MFRWFETRIDPFPEEPIRQPPATLLAFFWHYLRPVAWAFAALTAMTLIMAVIEVAIMAFIGRVVDLMKEAKTPHTFFADHGLELALMAGIALIVRPLVSALADFTKQQMIQGPVNIRTRWLAHRYVLRQSISYFQNDFAGRVATRVIQVGPAVRDVAGNTCDVVVWVVVHWIGAFALFFAADWRLVIPLTLWLIGYIIALTYFVPRIERASHDMSEARSMLTGRIVDSYTNIATVKLFAHTDHEDRYAREAQRQFLERYMAQLRLNTLMEIVLWSLNGLVLVATLGLAVWLWTGNLITIGAITVVSTLVIRLMNMSGWFMWTLAGIFDNIGVVQESMQTIARPLQVVDSPGAKPIDVPKGAIRYEAIGFHYEKAAVENVESAGRKSFWDSRKAARAKADPGEERAEPAKLAGMPSLPRRSVIERLTLDIAPGEKVGLVGRSGAGKSTLVNLLLRFYDLEKGRILIDGQNIAEVTQDSLRANIGVVTQDTSLLHRSVRDNIRYGRTEATEAEIVEAAKRAEAHEFILGLEDGRGRRGYDAHVGERGVKLSGGQRQRIAIARVLLKNAPILVLDEATSALDSEAEAA
ncbi:MAG TPA: ABC transporter ATP-binding protein, partial [Hyphomicrobiaceae bacterium]|nr:ABC transporter ATP-binding protein [Hyphomicrobiaceae bacterium]